MTRVVRTSAILFLLVCMAEMSTHLQAQSTTGSPESVEGQRQLKQLQTARAEIVRTLLHFQARIDTLPYAAETFRRMEAELRVRLDELDKQIADLRTPTHPASMPPKDRPTAAPRPRQEMTFSADTRFGFDRQDVIAPSQDPSAVLVKRDVKRSIISTVFSAEYPLSRDSSGVLVFPYIYQRMEASALGQSTIRVGSGIGDIMLLVVRRFPKIATGTELALSAGMQFPTGKDPYSLNERELPTGVGFYQPLFRITVQKLQIPVQLFAAAEYGTAFPRRVAGQRVTLPDSHGGEIGFAYAIGPEFVAQTSMSLRKVSTPLLLGPGLTEGYLSQSLVYRAGGQTSLRASVDVGLTADSIDFWLGAALRRNF